MNTQLNKKRREYWKQKLHSNIVDASTAAVLTDVFHAVVTSRSLGSATVSVSSGVSIGGACAGGHGPQNLGLPQVAHFSYTIPRGYSCSSSRVN